MIAPYYHSDRVTLYNADCIDVMRDMPDNSADLILTDPPYGIGESKEKNLSRGKLTTPTNYGHYEWDDKPMTNEQKDECLRVSRNQIFFGGNYFELPPSPCWIVWDKDNGKSDFADCELAWTSFKTAVRIFKWRWQGMLQEDMKHKEVRVHPTQKPVPLMEWIIANYSNPNDLIFDGFMGSGSTGVAAMKLNRRFIGVELSEEYCEIAKARIHAAELMAEADLFKPKG